MLAVTVVIEGIMADASAVGNGEDITAAVMVNGTAATGSPIKLADVSTGLDIKVTAATGLQCDKSTATATIMFTEGFNSAITAVADADPADYGRSTSARNSRPRVEFPRHSRRRDRDGEPDGRPERH